MFYFSYFFFFVTSYREIAIFTTHGQKHCRVDETRIARYFLYLLDPLNNVSDFLESPLEFFLDPGFCALLSRDTSAFPAKLPSFDVGDGFWSFPLFLWLRVLRMIKKTFNRNARGMKLKYVRVRKLIVKRGISWRPALADAAFHRNSYYDRPLFTKSPRRNSAFRAENIRACKARDFIETQSAIR